MDPYRFSWDADALVVIPGMAAAYLIALQRFPAPRWRIACFMAGCALMLAVQIGPADTLALHFLLTMHFLQNVAIAEWGPLLIVLGLTSAMANELLRIPGARALTHPLVALPIWSGLSSGRISPPCPSSRASGWGWTAWARSRRSRCAG